MRRIELLPTPGPVARLVDVLRLCPRVTILSKPYSIDGYSTTFWSGINELRPESLQYLTRIDWVADTSDPHGVVEHALRMLLVVAPNVRHLAATSILQPDPHNILHTLYSLESLRLPVRTMGEFLTLGSRVPFAPNLKHIVVNGAFLQSMRFFTDLTSFSRVECVEFQDGVSFNSSTLSLMCRMFPRCNDLAMPAGAVTFGLAVGETQKQIRRIRLYANPCGVLRDLTSWMKNYYEPLVNAFPAVEEVVLHGDWRFTLTANVMETLKEDLFNRSCACIFQDT